jgi:hypothetical protein
MGDSALNELRAVSSADALKYLAHHGEVMSSSNLRRLSTQGVIEAVLTSGGHRRYTKDALKGYLSGFDHKVFYIESCPFLNSIEVSTAQLEIMKSDRYYGLNLRSTSLPLLVIEIHNLLAEEKGSNSLFISYSPELLQSSYFQLLGTVLSELRITLTFCPQ